MAKMVSELGADVFDDTIVEKKSRFTKKQKNYIIGITSTVILAIALGLVYYFAATVWLIDYSNMAYIQYANNVFEDENGEITAQISRVLPGQDYPSNFRVPAEINGYRITKIADGAFAGCTGIKKITMTDNIEYIGDQAFAGCEDLEIIEFSKNITHIGNEAFLETPFYTNLPSDKAVFANEVLIHVGDELLGEKTVLVSNPTRDLNRIHEYLDAGHTVLDMDTFTVLTKDNLSNYSSLAGNTTVITQWIDGLFEEHDMIEVVEIPETLNFVPIKAFRDCSNLREVIINGEDITEIRESAFEGCINLETLEIPEQVSSIGNYVFKDTSVAFNHLPNTIKNLGVSVFENCTEIVNFVYPKSLSYVPAYTFAGCSNLIDFSFEDENEILTIDVGAFEYTGLSSFRVPKNITNLNDNLFAGCENLEYIELYDNVNKTIIEGTETVDRETHTVSGTLQGVNQIRASVFNGCSNFKTIKLYDEFNNIKLECVDPYTVYLPCTLERTATSTIGESKIQTFVGTQIKRVIFPASLVNIGSYMFQDVTSLEEVVFAPNTDGFVSVGEGAFYNCQGLTEISLPDSCSKVEMKAFQNCSNLAKIHLPEPLSTIGGFTSVNQNVFDGCTSLSEVNLRYGITQIASNAFRNCSSLRNLYIPSTITSIDETAFEGTTNLHVSTPILEGEEPKKWEDGWDDNLTVTQATLSYEDEETKSTFSFFQEGNDLSVASFTTKNRKDVTITLPDVVDGKTVKTISKYAFAANDKLVEITLPATLEAIGDRAFIDCINLKVIRYNGSLSQFNSINLGFDWKHGVNNELVLICDDITINLF